MVFLKKITQLEHLLVKSQRQICPLFLSVLIGGNQTVSKLSIIGEFWGFLKVRKKWWLAPIVIFLFLLSALIMFTQGSAVAPFIYTLF